MVSLLFVRLLLASLVAPSRAAASPPHLVFCLVSAKNPPVQLASSSKLTQWALVTRDLSALLLLALQVDDLGYNGLGFMGSNDEVKTPTIDGLAKGGVILDNHYTCAPPTAVLELVPWHRPRPICLPGLTRG
jgi:hypothetical protein